MKLSQEQRQHLEELISRGQAAARKLTHARVLLKADQGEQGPAWSDERIAEALEGGLSTIERIRRRFVEQGFEDALNRRQQSERPEKRKINGEHEAHLIALCCGKPPEGRERWTVRLLADAFVQLGSVDHVSFAEPGGRRGDRLARSLDDYRSIDDTVHMYLLERKGCVLSSQRGTFYADSLLFSGSLRNSWVLQQAKTM